MKFKIVAVKDGVDQVFYYDNMENILSNQDGLIFENGLNSKKTRNEYTSFSPEEPLLKSKDIKILKIQLGLTCNYSCEYCSQRFVPRADETSRKYINSFMQKLENINFNEEDGLKIELWGGEPFVYWKTIKPLIKALKEKFKSWTKKPYYSIISNGSLLTEEICDWIIENLDGFAISHDGPGQHVRGPDPFDDEKTAKIILDLYGKMKNKMSFNSMLNAQNMSRKKIYDWFKNFTGEDRLNIGEGSLVDAYDEGGIALSLNTKKEHFEFRRIAFKDLYENEGDLHFSIITNKINNYVNDVLIHNNAKYLGQKCGMDSENTIAVDLRGNVLTCQNVSEVSINSNGQPHLSGNLEDYDNVKVTTSTHWSNRKECSGCPVLHMCKGSCMFVSNEFWTKTCDNSYSDNVAVFAVAFEKITGHIPIYFDNEHLPAERRDIWGLILEHKEEVTNKPFPIPVISG